MTLYEVLWDNGECYEDNMTSSHIFTTLDKAKEYYNKKHTASGYSYGNETLTLYYFESDIEEQKRIKIESKVLDNPNLYTQDIEEEEWEPDMDDFGTCDVSDTY